MNCWFYWIILLNLGPFFVHTISPVYFFASLLLLRKNVASKSPVDLFSSNCCLYHLVWLLTKLSFPHRFYCSDLITCFSLPVVSWSSLRYYEQGVRFSRHSEVHLSEKLLNWQTFNEFYVKASKTSLSRSTSAAGAPLSSVLGGFADGQVASIQFNGGCCPGGIKGQRHWRVLLLFVQLVIYSCASHKVNHPLSHTVTLLFPPHQRAEWGWSLHIQSVTLQSKKSNQSV